MDCLGSPSRPAFSFSHYSKRVCFCRKTGEGVRSLCFSETRQAISALMVCLCLRTSRSFDAELSLISGLLSYFVLFELLVGDEVGKRNLQ